MPVTLVGQPRLRLSNISPIVYSNYVDIRVALWEGTAKIAIDSEYKKTWRIGWVQVVEKMTMTATYRRTILYQAVKPGKLPNDKLPALDSFAGIQYRERPFYNNLTERSNSRTYQVTPGPPAPPRRPGAAAVPSKPSEWTVAMVDRPGGKYDLWLDNDEDDPLEEFLMSLRFTTWVAARDLTSVTLENEELVLLAQWTIALDRKYTFTVVKDSNSSSLQMDSSRTRWIEAIPTNEPIVLRVSTMTPPPAVVWKKDVANECIEPKRQSRPSAPPSRVGPRIAQRQKELGL
jgi:hypothetical protein